VTLDIYEAAVDWEGLPVAMCPYLSDPVYHTNVNCPPLPAGAAVEHLGRNASRVTFADGDRMLVWASPPIVNVRQVGEKIRCQALTRATCDTIFDDFLARNPAATNVIGG
jgi:hypothetical protein